jgi:hypothetical protein
LPAISPLQGYLSRGRTLPGAILEGKGLPLSHAQLSFRITGSGAISVQIGWRCAFWK